MCIRDRSRLDGLTNEESFPDDDSIISAYKKGVAKGILKVLAKMGISTLQSYKGAQVFEAIGLKDEVINLAFVGTASRVQGIGFDVIFEESLRRHSLGYPNKKERAVVNNSSLKGGKYSYTIVYAPGEP